MEEEASDSSWEEEKEEKPKRKRKAKQRRSVGTAKAKTMKTALPKEALLANVRDPRCWVAFAVAKYRLSKRCPGVLLPPPQLPQPHQVHVPNPQLVLDFTLHDFLFDAQHELKARVAKCDAEQVVELGQALAFRVVEMHVNSTSLLRFDRDETCALVYTALRTQLTVDSQCAIALGILKELHASLEQDLLETRLGALDAAYCLVECLHQLAAAADHVAVQCLVQELHRRNACGLGDGHQLLAFRLMRLLLQ